MKYCEFHEDFGHCTTECFQLWEEIKALIINGYLKECMARMGYTQKFRDRAERKEDQNESTNEGEPRVPRRVIMLA